MSQRESRPASVPAPVIAAATGLACFAAYIGVSGSWSVGEIVLGAGVSALSGMAVAAAVRLAGVRQRLEVRWLARLGGPSVEVLTQVAPLTAALAGSLVRRRPLCATLTHRAFDPGREADPAAAGRRALVAVGLSIAPASLICERDLDCRDLLVADVGLKARPPGDDPCWPL